MSSEALDNHSVSKEQLWHDRLPEDYVRNAPPDDAPAVSRAVSLEETLVVVKEKVWSIGDALLRGAAEVLVGFGVDPSVLGYTEEELLEDEDGLESANRLPIQKDQVVTKTSFSMRSEENVNRRRAEEPLHPTDEEEEDRGISIVDDASTNVGWQGSSDNLSEEGGWEKKDK